MEKKNVLIVGGSGGIGIETAEVLLKKGMSVILTYRSDEKKIKDLVSKRDVGVSGMYQVDLANESSVSKMVSSVLEQHKRIDVVVYCATPAIKNSKVFDLQWDDFQEHLDVQLKGMFLLLKSLSGEIKKKNRMKFIAVLTEYCLGRPPSMVSQYVSAKYALMGFCKVMSSELAGYNCTFNMVSPGMVKTSLIANLPEKLVEMTVLNNPLKRIAEPSDVAKAIAFLSSEDSDYLNGVNMPVNGGNVLQ